MAAPYRPLDVEWEVVQAVEQLTGIDAGATSVPADLEDRLPFVLVQSQGGTVTDRVVDATRLSVDVWAGTTSEAMGAARTAFGAVMRLGDVSDVFRGDTAAYALPYAVQDEAHPSIARARFLVGVVTVSER